jgi:hypothetical protein
MERCSWTLQKNTSGLVFQTTYARLCFRVHYKRWMEAASHDWQPPSIAYTFQHICYRKEL